MKVLKNPDTVPVKAWIDGVPMGDRAKEQVMRTASMPFIHKHMALMPDVHWGMGSTIGSVIPTVGAIIPAAVGVDIGCGMIAVRTTLSASDLPEHLFGLRDRIEAYVPHGRSDNGGPNDQGRQADPLSNKHVSKAWGDLLPGYMHIRQNHPDMDRRNNVNHLAHLGTLGGGNHFIEVCLDESDNVWVMLHSGSRGVGNRIGQYFIRLAKKEMECWFINLPDKDLSYFAEGTDYFDDYVEAVGWAQDYAARNREIMMTETLRALRDTPGIPPFSLTQEAINCHHNYVARENHFGANVWLTRKGAVRARKGDLGIIPGSMGAKSYIVRGLGNKQSFNSCSHGAGRVMSRNFARKTFTVEDHVAATKGIECKKDESVLDETPGAYKDIDAVMEAQKDLVEVVHTLRQIVCVKG